MLQIIAGNSERSTSIYEWKIGQPRPEHATTFGGKYAFSNVARIIASEDELAYLKQRFVGIPFTNSEKVTWGAPWAQFIYDNLV